MRREGDGTCSLHIESTTSDDDGNYTIMAANPQVETRVQHCAALSERSGWYHCEWDLEKHELLRIAEDYEWEALRLCVTRAQYHNLKKHLATDGLLNPSAFVKVH